MALIFYTFVDEVEMILDCHKFSFKPFLVIDGLKFNTNNANTMQDSERLSQNLNHMLHW